MNKAVVLEIKEGYAAVLTDEGLVQKIRNENYEIGQEIELTVSTPVSTLTAGEKKTRNISGGFFRRWYRGAAAAAAVCILSGSGLYYASQNVFAYSTVTVTTEEGSMKLTLNKKDEVVAVRALDEKSEENAAKMEISVRKRSSLSDILQKITNGQEQAEFSVTSRNDERKEKIQNEVQEILPPVTREVPQPAATPPASEEAGRSKDAVTPPAPVEAKRPEDAAAPSAPTEDERPKDAAAPSAPAEDERPKDAATPSAPAEDERPKDAAAPPTPAEAQRPEDAAMSSTPAKPERPEDAAAPEMGETPPEGGMDMAHSP